MLRRVLRLPHARFDRKCTFSESQAFLLFYGFRFFFMDRKVFSDRAAISEAGFNRGRGTTT